MISCFLSNFQSIEVSSFNLIKYEFGRMNTAKYWYIYCALNSHIDKKLLNKDIKYISIPFCMKKYIYAHRRIRLNLDFESQHFKILLLFQRALQWQELFGKKNVCEGRISQR